uniref:LamG-like jellyroll fold domain-containing protein n=1 Tax=uncultured marine microorganism HF4000_ANIW141I9 TaxID=455537 RepID=B3T5F8_9ZZZZ|nr:hypothetical protein ALOHA_HF4000ANIW141I9ctg2g4 [uncultured marine microorganism HF4000_ANIW141I9]
MLTKLIHGAVFVFLLITFVMAQGGGYALDFDGVNDYVNMGDMLSQGAYTKVAWVKRETGNNNNNIISGNTGHALWAPPSYGYKLSAGHNLVWNSVQDTEALAIGEWNFVAVTYDPDVASGTMKLYKNGNEIDIATGIAVQDESNATYVGKYANGHYWKGSIDEVRVWNTSLTQSQIQAWMHKPIDTSHGNYSNSTSDNLKAYYQMSNGSGTSVTDNSANSNTGTLTNMADSDWITSNAPIGDLTSGYTTDVEALWEGSGTSASDASDGLTMVVGTALTDANFAVFGNNNTAGTSTSDLPSGVEVRSERIWYVDESNTVAADVTIDISDATGYTVTAGTASDYKLLNRSGTSGDFSILASGSSKSGDAVTFSSVTLSDEYLAIGQATDSDAYLSAHVTISGSSNHFRMMSSPVDGTVYDDILGPLWIQGMTNGDVTSGTANVWTYDYANTEWDALTNLNTASQVAGEGFLVYVFTDVDNDGDDDLPVTLSVSGTENSGSVEVPSSGANLADEAWLLAGNPYASTIDWDLVEQINVTTSAYVWDSQASTPAYISWNGSAGSLSNGLIAPYQGFWVQGDGGSGAIVIAEADKSGTAGTFYKTMNDSTGSMSFAISSGDYSDQTYVSFMNNGQEGIDNSDAYKLLPMSPSERVVAISYAEGNGLDINNLPYIHDGSISIPLDIMYLTLDENYNFVTQAEDVNMTWDLSSLPEHISMTLTDNITGNSVDLTQQSEVTFATVEKGSFPAYGSGGVSIYSQVGESRFTLTAAYSPLSAVDDGTNLPKEFALHPAYPNPFNPATTLSYILLEQANVNITIYDMLGRQVKSLINQTQDAGYRSVIWNATNDFGKPVSAGVYLYKIQAGEFVQTRKMVLLK